MRVIILKGIPASGKSTWAKNYILNLNLYGLWKRINCDSLRLMLDCVQFDKDKEDFIFQARNSLLNLALLNGYSVILDECNLQPKKTLSIYTIAREYNVKPEVKWFPISVEEAILRDKNRDASVGEDVIRMIYKQYLEDGGPL